MARLSLKPDTSFFRKIASGAVGARAVCDDLNRHGHQIVELERGSTSHKLWKDVKRKRVRIPDLVCVRCGLRVESRAKSEPKLALSHSETDAERAWDFGMVDSDLIAFPVCVAADDLSWHTGRLRQWSYWHERNWVKWEVQGAINYFAVGEFRGNAHSKATIKGVTEGSENFLIWDAVFSTRTGAIESVVDRKVKVRRQSDNHAYTWAVTEGLKVFVSQGETVQENQVLAGSVPPVDPEHLKCRGVVPEGHIPRLLKSKERTQRFTGVKLARLRNERTSEKAISELSRDAEEDLYVRLEAASYLVSVAGGPARTLFDPFLKATDGQNQLETIIALAENRSDEATALLCEILDSRTNPYFMRAATAWSLGQIGGQRAGQRLVQAFGDLDVSLREEALEAVLQVGGPAIPVLFAGLRENNDIAAGCAEALRRQQATLDGAAIATLVEELRGTTTGWSVWLAGMLPRARIAAAIAPLEKENPALHYAVTVLWGFLESWIGRNWDLSPGETPP